VRRDKRAIAIVIALAKTTSPASCPPMRRELSGRVADTVVASACRWLFADLPDAPASVGETVGKSPVGLVGGVNPLGKGGSEVPDTALPGSFGDGDADSDEITSTVALLLKDRALLARAVAVRVTFSPTEAASRTRAPATSSSLWPVGKSPRVHRSPLGCGHTVNRGASTFAAFPMLTTTLEFTLSASVLHTQIA